MTASDLLDLELDLMDDDIDACRYVGAPLDMQRMAREIKRHRGNALDGDDLASLRWMREFVDDRTFNYDGEAGRALGLIDRLLAVHGAKP